MAPRATRQTWVTRFFKFKLKHFECNLFFNLDSFHSILYNLFFLLLLETCNKVQSLTVSLILKNMWETHSLYRLYYRKYVYDILPHQFVKYGDHQYGSLIGHPCHVAFHGIDHSSLYFIESLQCNWICPKVKWLGKGSWTYTTLSRLRAPKRTQSLQG